MFKLALNAGHGLKTAGKRCMKKLDKNQTREWVLNSRICENIEIMLSEYDGYDLIRLDDPTGKQDIALAKRTKSANEYSADLYLSIHHNAGVNGGTGGGIETYVYTKSSKQSVEWQEKLYDCLIKYTNLKGNRADPIRKKNLYECRKSNMPCVLIECGFMDSKTDVPIILTEKFAKNVAAACVEVIAEKGKLKKKNNLTDKKDDIISLWQKSAQNDGFSFTDFGKWNKECDTVAKKAVCKRRVIHKYINLTKFLQEKLRVEADGKFGVITEKAVIDYQKKNQLEADGEVGIMTWKKLLGVKK